jgi:hypothetical protein
MTENNKIVRRGKPRRKGLGSLLKRRGPSPKQIKKHIKRQSGKARVQRTITNEVAKLSPESVHQIMKRQAQAKAVGGALKYHIDNRKVRGKRIVEDKLKKILKIGD